MNGKIIHNGNLGYVWDKIKELISSMQYTGSSTIFINSDNTLNVAEDVPSATVSLNCVWKDSSTHATISTGKTASIEKGRNAYLEAEWWWTHSDSTKDPESFSATNNIFGTELPASGVHLSGTYTNISSTKSIELDVFFPKTGLEVRAGSTKVTKATGTDTTINTMKMTVGQYEYLGSSTSVPSDSASVVSIGKRDNTLRDAKTNNWKYTFTVAPTTQQYFSYAYPSTYGQLTQIMYNTSTPSLGAFTLHTVNVTNSSGATQQYNVYTSNNLGAFNVGDVLEFKW